MQQQGELCFTHYLALAHITQPLMSCSHPPSMTRPLCVPAFPAPLPSHSWLKGELHFTCHPTLAHITMPLTSCSRRPSTTRPLHVPALPTPWPHCSWLASLSRGHQTPVGMVRPVMTSTLMRLRRPTLMPTL